MLFLKRINICIHNFFNREPQGLQPKQELASPWFVVWQTKSILLVLGRIKCTPSRFVPSRYCSVTFSVPNRLGGVHFILPRTNSMSLRVWIFLSFCKVSRGKRQRKSMKNQEFQGLNFLCKSFSLHFGGVCFLWIFWKTYFD